MRSMHKAGMDWSIIQPRKRTQKLHVSINTRHYKLTFSRGLMAVIGNPANVLLAFSPSPASIAIIPADQDDDCGYTVNYGVTRRRPGIGDRDGDDKLQSAPFCKALKAAGYNGTVNVPLHFHPDGLLWGDMSQATMRAGVAAS